MNGIAIKKYDFNNSKYTYLQSNNFTINLPHTEGKYELNFFVTDVAGNILSLSYYFTIIDNSIKIILISPQNNTEINIGSLINLTVSSISNDISVYYNWDNSDNQTLVSPYDLDAPSESGQHTLYVFAIDNQFNNKTAENFVFLVSASSGNIIDQNPDIDPMLLLLLGIVFTGLILGVVILLIRKK